jgi:outer membrane biosynthesis protein TonB
LRILAVFLLTLLSVACTHRLVIQAMPAMPDLSNVRSYPAGSSQVGDTLGGEGDSRPSLLHLGPLQYPREAGARGLQGWVVLDAIVGPDGRAEAQNARLVALSDSVFLQPAEQALMASEFTPGRKKGVPVRVLIRQPIFFRISH